MDTPAQAAIAPEDRSTFGLKGEVVAEAARRYGTAGIGGGDLQLLDSLAQRLLKMIPEGRPDEAAGTLEVPASAYTDPAVFAAEKAAIFDRVPVVAGLSRDIPEPGDFLLVDTLDNPVVVTRTRSGEVKAYLNACRHRGAALVYERRGNVKAGFTCPYHGWTYSTDGALTGVACPQSFGTVDKGAMGLVPVPCREQHGMIFLSPRPDQPLDLDAHLGAELAHELDLWHFDGVSGARTEPVELAGNWKLVYDTFLETYHFAAAHRNNLINFYHSNVNTVDRFGPHQRISVATRTLADQYAAAKGSAETLQPHVLVAYILFPGMVFINSPQVLEVFRIFPRAVDRTVVMHSCYSRLPAEMNGDDGLFEMIWQSAHNIVMNEDFPYGVTTAQQNLTRGGLKSLVIGKNELAIQNNYAAIRSFLA
jgi:phenylpropionate dioxygenase-like ring-hydroxylating dioxygenase large terminal subunit